MQTLLQDLRYGARMLLKNPGFTLIAVLTLALGIGANTAIFSVVNAVLLKPLPYKDADNIVMVWENNKRRSPDQRNVVNPANFMDWKEQNNVFSEMAAFIDVSAILTSDGEPEELPAQLASPNLFRLLGVEAIRGRAINADDGKPDAPRVAVLSYGLWQRRFGGDPKIIGRKLDLNRSEATVVGVMPAGFQWHIRQNSLSGRVADIWTPYVITNEMRQRRGRFLSTVARLKPGVTFDQAKAEMSGLGARLEQQYHFNTNWGINLVPLRTQLVGEIRLALWILLGAVAFVLLIACANVANLLLARASARQKEIAVRAALGAGRGTIVRQLLTESMLLSLFGGLAGLVLAWWGTEALIRLSPPELADLQAVKISGPVLLFTFGVAMLTGIIFGLVPAFEAARVDLNETLKEGGKHPGAAMRSHRLRNIFVVAEVALALVLLVGAGLLILSFAHLQSVDPGFNASNLLTMRVSLPGRKYDNNQKRLTFFRQATERLQTLPGVEAVSMVSFLPFGGPLYAGTGVEIEGRPKPLPGQGLGTGVLVADPNYFRTMQIPLKRGRLFSQQESAEMRHVVVINEAFARKHFPNEEPLGKRITIAMKDENAPCEIIGIVADSKFMSLEGAAEPLSYWPHPELAYPGMTIVLRTKGDAASMSNPAREVIREIDSEQPVSDVRTMESLLAKSVSRARFNTSLLAVFALVALLLAGIGIYGVMSYSVSQRRHELGIRLALGAQSRDVLRLVIRQGMKLALVGVGIGLTGALALMRLMSKLLFNVSATDPLTFGSIALLLAGVALLACWIPARRATKVDPLVALRHE
jgi:putative ABC transport system permease protein